MAKENIEENNNTEIAVSKTDLRTNLISRPFADELIFFIKNSF